MIGVGDGTFQPRKQYAVGQGTSLSGVAVGDFNEDGNIDVIATVSLTGSNGGSIALLLGKGDGTFRQPKYIATQNSPVSVVAADLNGDQHLDLWVGGNGDSSVLLGKGDGTFGPPTRYAVFGAADAVAMSDFNGDGKLDAAVVSDIENLVYVFLGNGDGTFQSPKRIDVGTTSLYSLVVADFNHDGKMDLAVSDVSTDNITIMLGNGDGSFQSRSVISSGGFVPFCLRAARINNDRNVDLVVANIGYQGQRAGVAFLKGIGDGTFKLQGLFRAGKAPTGIAIGRFNTDRKLDLAVSNLDSGTVSILLNTTK